MPIPTQRLLSATQPWQPELNEFGIEANYIDPAIWDKEAGIAELKKQFGIGQELILQFSPPYVYLNNTLIHSQGLDQAEVEKAVAEELMKLKGINFAISSKALMEGKVSDTPLLRSILNSHNPKRSGDVFIVFESHWFINDFDGLLARISHEHCVNMAVAISL